jgi:hypothetical protein
MTWHSPLANKSNNVMLILHMTFGLFPKQAKNLFFQKRKGPGSQVRRKLLKGLTWREIQLVLGLVINPGFKQLRNCEEFT